MLSFYGSIGSLQKKNEVSRRRKKGPRGPPRPPVAVPATTSTWWNGRPELPIGCRGGLFVDENAPVAQSDKTVSVVCVSHDFREDEREKGDKYMKASEKRGEIFSGPFVRLWDEQIRLSLCVALTGGCSCDLRLHLVSNIQGLQFTVGGRHGEHLFFMTPTG